VIKLLLLFALLISSLFADKFIYLTHQEIPSRVIKGEIFPLTIKSISTLKEYQDINYSFSGGKGVTLLEEISKREKRGKYYYETFYFLAQQSSAVLPDIEATLIAPFEHNATLLPGEELNIITLNPSKNFSNVIAENLEIVQYKTTSYDREHNIVIFIASAQRSDIKAMHFKGVFRQGSESIVESHDESRITYFVIVDKSLEDFTFTYFSLIENRFIPITIPIVVVEDSVATQSDLKPKDQSHERLKISIAAAIAVALAFFILLRKKYIYLVLMALPLGYILYSAMPDEIVCLNAGTKIQLLPVQNGTIFETTSKRSYLHKEGSSGNFTKVKLENEKIGWVKNENICAN